MHECNYTYIGENSMWKLTWPEIRVLFEGFYQMSESREARSTASRNGTSAETERYKDRLKKQSKSRAREQFKKSKGLS